MVTSKSTKKDFPRTEDDLDELQQHLQQQKQVMEG